MLELEIGLFGGKLNFDQSLPQFNSEKHSQFE